MDKAFLDNLRDRCRHLGKIGHEKISDTLYRVPEHLIVEAGKWNPSLGQTVPVPELIERHRGNIPFIGDIGIVRARTWHSGSDASTTLVDFDTGALGFIRVDRNPYCQPRSSHANLIQPWWFRNAGNVNYEISLFGFIPQNYTEDLDNLGRECAYEISKLSSFINKNPIADSYQNNITSLMPADGYLYLPDGTPYLFDPGEANRGIAPELAEEINALTPDQRRSEYLQDVKSFQTMLDMLFEGDPPFRYIKDDTPTLNKFFPMPDKLRAAIAEPELKEREFKLSDLARKPNSGPILGA